MDVFGLRSASVCDTIAQKDMDLSNPKVQASLNHKAELRIIAIVSFFLISIYLSNFFEKQLKTSEESENFFETDFKKLFEYVDKNNNLSVDEKKHMHHKSDDD